MTRREELAREAARLFAEKGYHGTSIGALAEAIGVQKGSLYAHIDGKQDLLYETMRQGAEAFHGCARRDPGVAARRRRRSASRCAGTCASWPASSSWPRCSCRSGGTWTGERRDEFVAERRRYEERIRSLFREGREQGELRSDLDESVAALLFLSAANWAFTWLRCRTPTPMAWRTRSTRS